MGETYFDADSAEAKELLEEELFRDMTYESYFSKFEGKDNKNIIQVKTELEKQKGDKITFFLRYKLQGEGITGSSGDSLEGNEEALQTADFNVYLEEYAHATRDRGPLDRQRAFFSIDEEARNALRDWGAEKAEKLAFAEIYNTRSKIFYGGLKSSLTALVPADKLTPTLISYIRTGASTGWNRSQIPIRGVMIDGKTHYVLLCHPDAVYDLKLDPTMAQALREAEVRGKDNPLFRNAVLVWDGVIIHTHELCPIGTNAGADGAVPYAKCVLMGAQAMCKALGKRPEIVAEEFDYKRKHGYGITLITKYKKAVFASKDFAVVGLDVARTRVSDPA